MPQETNLSVSPYFDDFDEAKNFYRILYRPSIPVQARELTQAQSILQNQIEKFGDSVYKNGTVIKGCSFTYDPNYNYVKLLDLQVDGQPVNASEFANTILTNSVGLKAVVVNYADGLQSQNPDLNTLYVKYQNSGSDYSKEFVAGEVLTSYDRDYSVQRVNVTTAGTGYSNSDILAFTSNTGTLAAGRIITNSSGAITSAVLTNGGSGYLTDPTVAVANSSGGASNGSSGVLAAQTMIAQLTIANTSFNSGNTASYLTVGTGYAFSVADGVIYQKGFFVSVEPQTIVVSKYNTVPTDVVVGFTTTETIVTENTDTTLLDGAQGYSNYTAPGAHRLKLTPTLALEAASDAVDSDKFFTLVEYQEGRVVRQQQAPQFNTIATEMAKRTAEESGDYIVSPFNVIVDDITANTTYSQARVGSGVAYISGYRTEQLDSFALPIRKGTDVQQKTTVSVSQAVGNYIYVNSLQGTFLFNNAVAVNLQDTVNSGLGAAAGTNLGTAKIRALAYDSGTPGDPAATYRLYIFDVQMNAGKNFADVKSVYYNGSFKGTADILLDASSKAVVYDGNLKSLVFSTGSKAVKTLRNLAANNNTTFTYSTVDTGLSFAANGTLIKTLTGEVFPYSGTLDSVSERDFIFVSQASVAAAANGAGNVAVSSSNTAVIGTSTAFLTDYTVGDYFITGSGEFRRITSIANNTYMTSNSNFAAANTSTNHKRYYPSGQPISFTTKATRTINISGATLTAQLGETLASSMAVTGVYNVQRTNTLALTKAINKTSYVKINPTANNVRGPWSLGLPDVQKLISVTKTANTDYVTATTDVTSHFVIDTGQKDTHYGLATLRLKPTSNLVLTASDYIAVAVDAFTWTTTGGGIGFFSVDSYPIDDTTTSLPANKIRTQEIPVYKSATSDIAVDLRDSIDFRPVCANTANVSSTIGGATVNPSLTETFAASEKYFPAPTKIFNTDLQYYLGRFDKVVMNNKGTLSIVEGVVTNNAYPPADVNGALTIATIKVPPYPSLSLKNGNTYKRLDYTYGIALNEKKRYTMSDIGRIDNRVTNLEYYSALSLLEKQTKDLVIPSALDPTLDTFKNGIFVDPFTDMSLTNIIDGEFTASIDMSKNELVPRFKQSRFEVQVANSTNMSVTDDMATIATTSAEYIVQPYASKARTLTQAHWSFQGNVELFPAYFNYYDIRFDPNVNLGQNGNLSSFNNNVYYNSTTGKVSLTQDNNYNVNIYTDQSFINQIKLLIPAPTTTNSSTAFVKQPISATVIGDFLKVSGVGEPFIYQHSILLKATGLRPNTTYQARFDGVDVTYWTVGFSEATWTRNVANRYNFLGAGFGNPAHPVLTTNAAGEVFGAFFLPRGYFFTGARLFELVDHLTSPTSIASTIYRSYEYDVNANPAIVSTRPISSSKNILITNSNSLAQGSVGTSPFNITVPTQFGSTGTLSNVVTPTPLSQTFYVGSQDTNNQEGLHLTKVDLYFKERDPTLGVSIEIRTVENNVPTSTVVPGSFVHLKTSEVNTSTTAATKTTFNFAHPVFLRAGYKYAIVVKADGNSPGYEVWIGQAGASDRTRTTIKCRQDWGEGELFVSTNDTQWQSVSDEDLKFTLHRSVFASTTGTITLTNRDDEYFSIANTSGNFIHSEPVFSFSNTYVITGNVTVTSGSTTVTGVGTSFLSQVAAGAILHVANTASPNVASGFTSFIVNSVANNTSLSLVSTPNFNGTTVKAYIAPTGIVTHYSTADQELHVTASTAANSTFKFATNDILVGTITGASAKVTAINNLPIDYYNVLMYRTAVSGTTVDASVAVSNTSLALQSYTPIKFNDTNTVTGTRAVLGSKSNEIVAGYGKSFAMKINVSTGSNIVSPTVDIRASSVIRYENWINNDYTNENTSQGNAASKYVSKSVVLANGQDAEALTVYLNGYKPAGSEIQVYARLLNTNDPDYLKEKSWVKMDLVGSDIQGNPTNLNDFYEYQYKLANTGTTVMSSGVIATSNTTATITGSNTFFSSELASGDVVKIQDVLNNRYFITKIASTPASNTSLTITSNSAWTTTGATIEKLSDPKSPFIDPRNSGIVTYYGNNSVYDSFKTFAVKVVLLSSQSNIVPRVKDLRVIARSV